MIMIRAKQKRNKDWEKGTEYIYVNGCSNTEGTDLALPNDYDAYPFILADLLGSNVISSASCGSSNHRICRSTIDFLCDIDVLPEIVVIQWTGTDRFETPYNFDMIENDNSYEGWKQHLPYSSVQTNRNFLNIHYRGFYRSNFYSTKDQMKKNWEGMDPEIETKRETAWATQMLSLDAYIKSLGIKKVIHFPFTKVWTYDTNPVLQAAFDTIDCPMEQKDTGMRWPLRDHGYKPCGDIIPGLNERDGHYMADAHYQIALWLYDYLKYGTTIKIKTADEYLDDREMNHYKLGR
jgi:hypothetical protein